MNLASVCFTQLWLKKSNPQISLYTVPFISFCTTCLLSTGKQKWGNFKEQPTWHLQHWAIAQFETLPKHQASCFAIRRGGEKAKQAGGAQGEEWDGRNREEEKGSGELWGWTMAGWLQPPQSIPCLERPGSRGVWCSGEKMHKENIFDVNVNVF